MSTTTNLLYHHGEDAKMREILQFWGLSYPTDILPRDFAPRPHISKGKNFTFSDLNTNGDVEPIPPENWTKAFVVEIWKLAKDTQMAYGEAMEILKEVVQRRHNDPNNLFAGVVEILRADIRDAWNIKRARMRELAGEALDVALFTNDLREGIEGIEQDIITEDNKVNTLFTGNMKEEIAGIEQDIKDEDDTMKGMEDMSLN